MPKVLVTPTTLMDVDGPYLQALRDGGFEIVLPKKRAPLTEEDLFQELPGIAAAVAGSEPYTRKVLEHFKELRVVARAGVGYDAVDLAAATDCGVAVTITPGANNDSVAEHTFAMLLALAKNLRQQDQDTRAARWKRDATLPLRGRTLGIVGLGRIGKSVALRAAAFDMKVIAHEPFPDQAFVARQKISLVPLDQLFREADFITLHTPLTPESKHLVNQRSLGLMKPSAYLINTARGGLVCEADLLVALKARRIAGAALDVFEEEPPGKIPLFELDNVLLTPHTAGIDEQSRLDMALLAAQSIVALSRGQWPAEQVVNPQVKAKFRW